MAVRGNNTNRDNDRTSSNSVQDAERSTSADDENSVVNAVEDDELVEDSEELDNSTLDEQRKKVAKREKFDSGIGEEMENGKGLTSSDSDISNSDNELMDDNSDSDFTDMFGSPTTTTTIHKTDGTVFTDKDNAVNNKEQSADKGVSSSTNNTSSTADKDNEITYSRIMRQRILELPLPYTLKQYLNYYREF